jgi:hypothetical protein
VLCSLAPSAATAVESCREQSVYSAEFWAFGIGVACNRNSPDGSGKQRGHE